MVKCVGKVVLLWSMIIYYLFLILLSPIELLYFTITSLALFLTLTTLITLITLFTLIIISFFIILTTFIKSSFQNQTQFLPPMHQIKQRPLQNSIGLFGSIVPVLYLIFVKFHIISLINITS